MPGKGWIGRLFHRRRRGTAGLRLLWAGLLLAATLAALPAACAHAQQGRWTPPHSFGPYWFPDVAADPSGRVHVVWSNSESGFDLVMYSDSETGDEWSAPIDIAAYIPSEGTSEATRPTLSAGPDGTLYLSSRLIDVYVTHARAASAGNAANWSAPESMGEGYFSRMAIDRTGTLHLLFTQNSADPVCLICYHLYATRSADGGKIWTPPVDLSARPTGTSKPQIAVDGDNGLHVVFEQGTGGSLGRVSDPSIVMYMQSLDGGETWSTPAPLSQPAQSASTDDAPASQRNVAIAYTGDGTLLTVWWSIPDDRVLFQVSSDNGQTWSAPQAVPGVVGIWSVIQSRLDSYALAVDSSGVAHLVMVGRQSLDQTDLELLHLRWDGRGWSQPETIVRYQNRYPEWPRIAVGLGNVLHVVWFMRNSDDVFQSESGNYEVLYARSLADSPAVAAVSLPESQPDNDTVALPNPLPAQTAAAAAPVRLPPINPSERVSLSLVMSENDDVMLVGLSLLPALLLILGAAAYRRRR